MTAGRRPLFNLPERRKIAKFLFAFACVFVGLALPSRGLGPLYTAAHTSLGNALVAGRSFDSGARLHFETDPAGKNAWQTTLVVQTPRTREPARIPIDLRSLSFLPLVTFIALCVSVTLSHPRRNALVLGTGLLILEPLLLLLIALPLLSLLATSGPLHVLSLGRASRVVMSVLYRALVAPPAMAYAIPLFLFWLLAISIGREHASHDQSEIVSQSP